MIPVQPLLTSANTAISNLTAASCSLDYLRLLSISKDSTNGYCYSVANTASLPTASCNKGRIVYVQDICDYRISDGNQWTNDFVSSNSSVLYAWGPNLNGQLGDSTSVSKSSPVSVVGQIGWSDISSGSTHSLGVSSIGAAWAWGCGSAGRLGTNSITDRSSPVSVAGSFTDWCQVSAGSGHSLGLRTNGTAWAWGAGSNGQLGNNCTSNFSSPVAVVGGFTDWRQVSAGRYYTLGLRTNGTLWAWGFNSYGRLGDGTTNNASSPVSVIGGFTDWCQVSAGCSHNIAIRQNCTIWTWGVGSNGQLGNNCTSNFSSPVSVVGGFTDWCQVSAGTSFSLAIRSNGTMWAWGYNLSGQLGTNGGGNQSSPVSVVGGFTDWCCVDAGELHTLALRTNGTLWAWGENVGRLGNDNNLPTSSPVSVAGGFTDWFRISAGGSSLASRNKKGF